MNVWLPTTNCGIATCLNRAIGTTGLSPVRLRPSRPLHARDCRVPTVHQVSKALGISQGYLTKDGKYMQRLFALLKVRGRTQAVAEAMRRRLID